MKKKDHEPKLVHEYRCRSDGSKWKDTIQAELNSLTKCEVFGLVVWTTKSVKPVDRF